MYKKLLFGTAGTPHCTKKRTSIEGIKQVKLLNLDCMELEFVRGVRMKEVLAKEIYVIAKQENIALSVHAPYYINLNSKESEKITASIERIYQSARIGALSGANSIVFHPAYYQGINKDVVYKKVAKILKTLTKRLDDEGKSVTLRPETTGKPTQFGDLDELINLGVEIEGVLPCIDFAHLHARDNGLWNSYNEFLLVLNKIEEKLGKQGLNDMHIHISGINYGLKGEKNHLNLLESDLKFIELLKALKEYNTKGLIICESPNIEDDALLLKKTYASL